jgi:hypothetical protein
MSNSIAFANGSAQVTLTAGQSIALYSLAQVQVFELVGFPNYPVQENLQATFTGYQILGPYANGATLAISPGPGDVLYSIGVAPVVSGVAYQGAPAAQNTAGTLTTAEVTGGIVTTTQATGATIAVLLPNGADMDDASQFDVNESFDWVLINNSAAAADTVTITNAASGNNISGPAIVAATTSAIFRTRKTAADTFVTYRIA